VKLLFRVFLKSSTALLALAIIFVVGCKRDDVKVYQVTKEDSSTAPTPAPNASGMAAPVQTENSQPQLQFALPPGWTQIAPSEMRVASFSITNANGPAADVGVIPLPAAGESELAIVNMWRAQVQLPDATNSDFQTISVGNDPAKLFEVAGTAPTFEGKYPQRIFVAELTRGATSWFFKLTGEDAFVASQKENFLQFLKSVSFVEAAPALAAAPAAENQNANPNVNSIWTIPAGWKSVTPSSTMLFAQFLIQDGDAKAEVNISQLAGEGGGLLANVNRWRGQLGLPQVAQEDDFSKMVSSVDSANGQIQIVDMNGTNAKTGQPARLVGAVVPQNGQSWFYKLMGDEKIVAAQKEAFIKFIQSANYPK
jgi:hypothetical protein